MHGSPGGPYRIPIAAIMAIIAVLAVEFAALRAASADYVDVTRKLTVVLLALAAYLARSRSRDRAAWWFGFALVGWAYFAMVIDESARRGNNPMGKAMELPPMALIGLLLGNEGLFSNSGALIKRWWNQYEIVQSIFTLVLATLGGLACSMMTRCRGTPYCEEARRSGTLDLVDQVNSPGTSRSHEHTC
jgi:hypothetical protein